LAELIGWDPPAEFILERSEGLGTSSLHYGRDKFGLTVVIAYGGYSIEQKQINSADVFTNPNFLQLKLAFFMLTFLIKVNIG